MNTINKPNNLIFLILLVISGLSLNLCAQDSDTILSQEYEKVLGASDDSAKWLLVNRSNKLLNSRLKRKGASVLGIKAANSLMALSYTAVTLNTLYQFSAPNFPIAQGVLSTPITSALVYYFGRNVVNATKNYDQRSLRKIFRELKKNENIYLENLKADLAKINIEFVDFKNNVNTKWNSFYKYGKPSFTLTLRVNDNIENRSGVKVALTYEPVVKYSKNGKILSISFNKSVELAERTFTQTQAQQDHLRKSLNTLFEGLKGFNVCDNLLF